jgi:hypothetical protein
VYFSKEIQQRFGSTGSVLSFPPFLLLQRFFDNVEALVEDSNAKPPLLKMRDYV